MNNRAQVAERVDAERLRSPRLRGKYAELIPHESFKSIPCAFILSHIKCIGVLNNYLNIWR